MVHQVISIIRERPWVTLEYYGNDLSGGPRDTMLVIPGGGYQTVCSDREGHPIALAYLLQNRNAFILNYSVGEQINYPLQVLEEALLSVKYIREHAREYDIDPERVFAVGFSAGAHLAGWLGTCWNKQGLLSLISARRIYKPKGVILCYPVVSAYSEKENSFENLFRTSPITNEQLESVSLYNHVDSDSSPAFLLHTYDDEAVPVRNSLDLARAYEKAGVPFELHIYPHGPHGVALGSRVTYINKPDYVNQQIARWVDDSCIWMDAL